MPQQNDEVLEKQIEEKEKILAKMLNLESLSIPTTDVSSTYDSPTHTSTYKYVDTQEKTDPEKTYTRDNVYTEVYRQVKTYKNEISNADKKENLTQEYKTVKPVGKTMEFIPIDLIPSVVKLPNTWNLDNMELKLDVKMNGFKDNRVISPDENLDSEWEIV